MSAFTTVEEYEYNGTVLTTELDHIKPFVKAVYESAKYRSWVDSMDDSQVELKKYTLISVPIFAGPPIPEKLLFFKGIAEVYDIALGGIKIIANIGVNRGGSTACLVIIEVPEIGNTYVALTEQMRWMTGGRRIEVVAGMKNEATDDLEGPIIQELKEEMGIELNLNDPRMRKLGEPFWTSQGLLDEKIDPWVLEMEITEEKYKNMKASIYGEEHEGENIRIRFFDLETIETELFDIGDAKLEVLLSRYQRLLRSRQRFMRNRWSQTPI